MRLRRSAATSGFWIRISPVRQSRSRVTLISSRRSACSAGCGAGPRVLEQMEKPAVLFERRRALRLGGMRGQHRLDDDAPQSGGDPRRRQSGCRRRSRLAPHKPDSAAGPPAFARTAHLGGDIFLDEIEQLESRGVDLSETGGQFAGNVGRRDSRPAAATSTGRIPPGAARRVRSRTSRRHSIRKRRSSSILSARLPTVRSDGALM